MTFSNLNLNHHTEHKTIANDWEENRESSFLLQISKNVAIVGLQGGKRMKITRGQQVINI